MKPRKSILAVMAATVLIAFVIGGCSSGKGSESSPQSTGTGTGTSGQAAVGPFGKYDPPIEVTMVRSIDASFKFAEGESLDKNIWNTIFEEELGIRLRNLWVVDSSQYRQKLNVSITSGDLPDIMAVNKNELQRLYESDLLADLTEAYEKYASPFTKDVLNKDGGNALKSVTYNGKLMAIPSTFENLGVASASMIWIRTDWLEKLNLPEPKTMDDVLNIARAFATRDPDGNGKPDTIGLGIHNQFLKYDESQGYFATLIGFFNGYHAYPDIWLQDSSGQLVYGLLQPEVKPALQKLQELYREGVLDKEFAVKSWQKVSEDIAAGRIGLIFGGVADATFVLRNNRANDPNAQWKAFPLVSVDDKPAVPQVQDSAITFYVVRKGAKHPEAAFLMLNTYLKKYLDTDYSGSRNPFAIDPATGIFPAKYAPIIANPVTMNVDAHIQVVEELNNNGDGSRLNFPASLHFERNKAYRAGDDGMWFSDRTFGPEGSFSVIREYSDQKRFLFNAFSGAPTPTMVEKETTLNKMRDETMTKIIMGEASIDEFDKFLNEWRKLGGDDITREVNEWYKQNK